MKLKNKKTGEIVEVESLGHEESLKEKFGYQVTLSWELDENLGTCKTYTSLAELNEDWEDAPEEPITYYYISDFGAIREGDVGKFVEDEIARKEIGNYFATEEEAEKAVERLRARKRLKDKGFRFTDYDYRAYKGKGCGQVFFNDVSDNINEIKADLDICFGDKE